MTALAVVACLAATGLAGVRWARVLQREHYLSSSCWRIARLWIVARPLNLAVLGGAAAGFVAALVAAAGSVRTLGALGVAAAVAGFPLWLPLRGRDRPLRWTRRLLTLTGTAAVIAPAFAVIVGLLSNWTAAAAALALAVPCAFEVALIVRRPMEERIARRFQTSAERRLRAVAPGVIAVTGSWGKTTTKNHIRDLAGSSLRTLASPASFNNRGGLSRTLNEHLTDDTELFVAEMGMYQPGEIRALCSWVRPDVGVITAIGPMHLEHAGSIERIVEGKAEILEGVTQAVLWVEDPRLAALADRVASRGGVRVWRCGAHGAPDLDVSIEETATSWVVRVRGEQIGTIGEPAGLHPGNVACAVAAVAAVDVPLAAIGARLDHLATTEHRAAVGHTPAGVMVIDDTFNSNPVGARAAITTLRELAAGRRVVVTPGMMELGRAQHAENAALAAAVVESGAELAVVGRTNRRSLLHGAGAGATSRFASRRAAAEWIGRELGAGDGVLWENDLPDHYP